MTTAQKLQSLIATHLDKINKDKLPRLAQFIASEAGRENAEDMIFNMCKQSGISVQTAMSTLDSDLPTNE